MQNSNSWTYGNYVKKKIILFLLQNLLLHEILLGGNVKKLTGLWQDSSAVTFINIYHSLVILQYGNLLVS